MDSCAIIANKSRVGVGELIPTLPSGDGLLMGSVAGASPCAVSAPVKPLSLAHFANRSRVDGSFVFAIVLCLLVAVVIGSWALSIRAAVASVLRPVSVLPGADRGPLWEVLFIS